MREVVKKELKKQINKLSLERQQQVKDFEKRAGRGSRRKFERALSKVKKVEPVRGDSIKRNG